MSNINVMRKNLGPVTAYKYAVQQGYTGTEQEFAALMASYATVAETAEAAKDDAVDAKTAAEAAQVAAEAAAEQAEGAIEVDDTLSVAGRPADAAETGKLKTKLNDAVEPLNVCYVTDNVSAVHYGVTYERVDRYTLKLYGVSTGIGNITVFNGSNGYTNSGSASPVKNIQKGMYTWVIDLISGLDNWWICFTSATMADREEFAISSYSRNLIDLEEDGVMFIRFAKNANFGTEENPTIVKFALYAGESSIDSVVEKSVVAVDSAARESIESIEQRLNPQKSLYDKGEFCTYRADFAGYYVGRNTSYDSGYDAETHTGFGRYTPYEYVIQKFDELMALDPAHITKKALGLASGTDASENPYTIYEYTFTPISYKPSAFVSNNYLKKNPVILCDAAIHGFEKNSTYGLYYFLYDLVNNYHKDPILCAIRTNVFIKIIPVSNPWGFDNNNYYNANDVNINRNFYESQWEADVDDHTGLSPFDQPESIILRDWILENVDNLMLYLNVHTNGQYYSSSYANANALMPKFSRSADDSFYNRLAYIVQRHVQMQTAQVTNMYNIALNGSFFGRYQGETSSVGTASIWAVEQAKAVAMTFEMFNGISIDGTNIIDLFSSDSKKICSELLGNVIAQTIFEYS